ncbi:MAG TPA: hypothetical protein VMU15_14785 [Anaeromyxobacter sp.]|nr:hypothetical protein [Anaeromyxobacter sp.]
MIPALAFALLLAAGPPPRPEPPPAGTRGADRVEPERQRLSDEDAAVVEHLELLEQMDLLEDLPVVDVGEEAASEPQRANEKPRR